MPSGVVDAERVITEILSLWLPGYFAGAMPLLRRFADLHAEAVNLFDQLERARVGSRRASLLIGRVCDNITETCELAELLHLLPGDRGKPPPRL
jgi:hypothetical protein